MSLIVGSNASDFEALRQAVPKASGRRVYFPEVSFIPQQWPIVEGSSAVLSIRPLPTDLLAGKLDAQIRALLTTAPPDSALNTWHEAGNLADYNALGYITPETMTRVHLYMQNLCKGTSVSYGAILCMPPTSMPPWMPGGLDWYGLDIYDWPQFRLPDGAIDIHGRLERRLDLWLQVIRQVSGQKSPHLNICETNSNRLLYRAQWFTAVGQWLAANGGDRLLAFFSAAGCGPWLPDDEVTIAALKALTEL